jgi:hypothetical protein
MIRFEHVRLPEGTQALALREDGAIVVYVSAGLSARERLSAIRQALRAAPAAGWRSPRSPVLLPALAGCVGLHGAPEGRAAYRAAVAVIVVTVAAMLGAATGMTVSLQHSTARQPLALQPSSRLPGGPGPAPGQPAAGQGPGTTHQPGTRAGSSPAQPGSARGPVPKPAKTTTTSAGGPAPSPEAPGTSAPVPTTSPSTQPSPSSSAQPSPSSSPSPAKQSGGSSSCVDLLGITVCL